MSQRQTLDELDPPAWGEPAFSSHLVTTCHALRKKPVADFETEDLRMMIGQAVGLQWLVPLALDVLEKDAWAEGAYYEGDLLVSTLRVSDDYWSVTPKLLKRFQMTLSELDDARLQDETYAAEVAGFMDRYPSP